MRQRSPPGACTRIATVCSPGASGSPAQHGHVAAPVVVGRDRATVEDVDGVAARLVAVGEQGALVAVGVHEAGRGVEAPAPHELHRPPALEGRRARQDRQRLGEHGVARRAQQVLEAGALVEGEDLVLPGPLLPGGGHLRQLVGELAGQVAQLGRVLDEVVELPLRVVEGGPRLVEGHDLPPVAVVAAVPDHLVDHLGGLLGGVGVAQGGDHRRARLGLQGAARRARSVPGPRAGRGPWAARSETWAYWRRRVAAADPARRPRHEERDGVAAGVGVDLVQPERGVAGHRPAPRVVGAGLGAADEVEALVVGVDVVAGGEVDHVAGGADHLALAGGPVVGGEHDDGVVELADLLERVEQAARRCGRRSSTMAAKTSMWRAKSSLLALGEGVPGGHVVVGLAVAGRQLGALGQQTPSSSWRR